MTHAVSERIRSLQQAIQTVERDRDLSPEGRAKRVARYKSELANFQSIAHSELKSDWAALKKQYGALTARRQAAEEQAAAGWDFQRLAYEGQRAGAFIRQTVASFNPLMGGLSPAESIAEHYKTVASSGDKHAARAWAEVGAAELAAADLGAGTGGLLRLMQADSARLLATPELERVAADGDKLTHRARELDAATKEAGQAYGEDGGAFARSSFSNLSAGFNLTERVNVETLGTTYTLSYEESAADPSGGGVVWSQAPAAGEAVSG